MSFQSNVRRFADDFRRHLDSGQERTNNERVDNLWRWMSDSFNLSANRYDDEVKLLEARIAPAAKGAKAVHLNQEQSDC